MMYPFVLDHPVVDSYFRYPSSTRVLDKILDMSTRAVKSSIRTALIIISYGADFVSQSCITL